MFYYLFMPVVGLVQLWLCFRKTKLGVRLIPLLAGIAMELASWGLLFAVFSVTSDPSLDMAAVISLGILFGIQILFAAAVAWLTYGAVVLLKKFLKKE